MNRTEFINWLENKSGLSRRNDNSDDEWRELMNYAEYIWDELTVEDDKVIFNWEEWEWGGINYRSRECSFDEFAELYECGGLK
jgi:hypothetical protein